MAGRIMAIAAAISYLNLGDVCSGSAGTSSPPAVDTGGLLVRIEAATVLLYSNAPRSGAEPLNNRLVIFTPLLTSAELGDKRRN